MNWLDIVIIACIAIGIIHGLVTGIVKQVIALVSLVAAILLSGALANRIHQWIQPYSQNENSWFSPNIQNAIYYILAFILIISLFAILANLVGKIINYTPAGFIDKLFGALFGAFMWALCLSILLNFIAVFESQSKLISKPAKENSVCYEYVIALFPTIFPYIKDFLSIKQCQTIPTIY
jgi:membrane protein required for colicin V production